MAISFLDIDNGNIAKVKKNGKNDKLNKNGNFSGLANIAKQIGNLSSKLIKDNGKA